MLDGPKNPWESDPIVAPAGGDGPVFGPPPTPKEQPIPSGYERDPANPGGLRPTPGGPADPNGGDSLDPKTVSFYAQQVLSGAPMPAMGMGKQASIMRQKVMEEVARQAGAQGLSGADLARQITHYKAQSANISNLEKQLGTVTQAEQTALANGQQFLDRSLELPGQTEYPILNSITQTIQRNAPVPGHETVSSMDVAWKTFTDEYAKVVAGSPTGSGTLSDSARKEAKDVLQSNAGPKQKQAALAQMKADMANRIAASHSVIEDSYKNLTSKPGYSVPTDLGQFSLPGGSPPTGGSGGGGSGGGGGGDGPPGTSLLSADQSQAYKAFLAANPRPSGDQVSSFLSHLTGKTVTNGDEIAAAIAKGQGVNTTVENLTEKQRISDKADAMMRDGGGAGSAAIAGAGDTLSMGLLDEAGAGVTALGESLTGHGSFAGNYSTDVGANRLYQQRLHGEHPWAYTGGQIGGGLLLPVGEVGSALDAAKVGAAYGGAYGFGSGDNGIGTRIYGGALGAVTGGAAGAGGHAAVSALAPYVAPVVNKVLPIGRRDPLGMAPDVANAAQAEGVDLIRPMVDPASRGKFGALESQPGSQSVIRQGVDKVRGQIESRVAQLGQGKDPIFIEGPNGAPATFYHGTTRKFEGLPSKSSGRGDVVVYSPDPQVASRYAGSQLVEQHGSFGDQRVLPVRIKSDDLGDFRNPSDVSKATAYFQGKGVPFSTDSLKTGEWSLWEDPEMWKALGWKGAYVAEGGRNGSRQINVALADPSRAVSIFDKAGTTGQRGTALDTDAAGERIQGAARQFIQRSKGVADRLYNRAHAIAGDTRFVPQKAIDAVDQSISDLSANPTTNAAEIRFLQGVKSDLSTPGGKSVEELRQLRQSLRGTINEKNLTGTQAEGRAIAALDATHADAAANLPKGAADAFRRADAFYRERMVHIDDILQRFLGGNVEKGQALVSGEQAFTRLKSMMAPGGDARRLAGLMRDLEPSERQDISATIAASLGRRSPDEPFSSDLFISQTNKLSPQARRTIFGADGAQSIDNLRLLSQKLKEGVGDFNRSKTANSLWRQMASGFVGSLTGLGGAAGIVEGGVAGGASGAATGLLAGAAVKGTQMARNVLSARAMVNPRVSRWLAQAADVSTPSQAKAAVNSLRLVISREPALAHELLPIHQFLDQRVTELLAAQPSDNDQRN